MQKPCQDSYYTLFSSYPMLLDYHEEQAKNSRWIRCKVADLQVEPLGESSPLIGNLSAFAAGTSQEAVKDTAENLGLAMRVNGELYPVRMTAYKSLLDRAKIGGTALSKLSREVLAEVLNECLKLYSADALLLIRDEKISAVHSGDEVDYSILPIDELLKALQAKLDARFSGNEFESGYCDHSLVSASWRIKHHSKRKAKRSGHRLQFVEFLPTRFMLEHLYKEFELGPIIKSKQLSSMNRISGQFTKTHMKRS